MIGWLVSIAVATPGPEKWPDPLRIEVYGGTAFPTSVAVGAELGVRRFRLAADLGALPGGYASAIDGFAGSLELYDPAIGQLVLDSLTESGLFHMDVGAYALRTDRRVTAYGAVGFDVAALRGASTSTAVLETLTGNSLGFLGQLFNLPVEAESSIALIDLRIGMRIFLGTPSQGRHPWVDPKKGHWSIRTELGYVGAVGSETHLFILGAPQPALDTIVDPLLDEVYRQYVRAPVIGLWVGYHFGMETVAPK